MKWFKHISDSLDDPFIFDLMAQHGDAGYVIFFGILEIYAREFHPEDGWKLEISWNYLRTKLHRTRNKQIENILRSIQVKNKWEIVLTDNDVSIFIPKFKELLDDWTTRKVSKAKENYVVTTEKLQYQEDKDKEKDKKNIYTPLFFEDFWKAYPKRNGKKVGRKECLEYFKSFANGDRELVIIAAQNYAKSKDAKDGYARDPIRFLKKDFWKDWIETPKTINESEFL